jgi:hypothetical protein
MFIMNTQLKPLLIILGILAIFLAFREVLPKIRQSESLYVASLREVPKDGITSIILTQGKDTVTLKKDGNDWKVGDKKADNTKIDELLVSLYPTDFPETVSTSKDRYSEYGVSEDNSFIVSLNDKIKLFIGKSGTFGTYVRLDGKDGVFALKNITTSTLTPTIGNWADKKIVGVDRTKIKKLTLVKAGINFSIVKKDDKWVKEGTDVEIAKDKMENAFLTIGSFMATSLATTDEQKNYPKLPELTLTIEEDTNQTLEFFKGEKDYLVRRTSDGELYTVSTSMVDSISALTQ